VDGDDLTWYDRFANGLNCPQISPNEFQKMDTAPLATKGDGALALDRSQLENYVAGVTPRAAAGGPTAPNSPFCTGLSRAEGDPTIDSVDRDAIRALWIDRVEAGADRYIEVPVAIDLAGGEIMAQFTIHFDRSVLSISDIAGADANPDVRLGDRLPDGTRVIVNTSGINGGDIGIVVNFNGSGYEPAITAGSGTTTLVTLRFQVTERSGRAKAPLVTFNDGVFQIKLSDALGRSLPLMQTSRTEP